MKTFTLMLLALMMSTFSFAQKPVIVSEALVKNVPLRQMPAKAASAKAPAKAPEIVTPPADGRKAYYTASGSANDGAFRISRTIEVVWAGQSDVYVKGLTYLMRESYIHGTIQGDGKTVVFPMNQYLGLYNNSVPIYAFGLSDSNSFVDIAAEYDSENDSFTFTTNIADAGEAGFYSKVDKGLVLTHGGVLPVVAPANLSVSEYTFNATSGSTPVSFPVKIGFDGNDVYVQGLCSFTPEAWVKGQLKDGQITFPTGQLFGYTPAYVNYTFWFLGYAQNVVQDMVFDYDAEKGLLTSNQFLYIAFDKETPAYGVGGAYSNISIQKVAEKAATPANPSVTTILFTTYAPILRLGIALRDTEGNGLLADKVYYKVFCDTGDGNAVPVTFSTADYTKLTADMTEIPVSFTDNYDFLSGPSINLNMKGYETWRRIGVQTIYYGGGERHESEIGWYNPVWPKTVTVPEGLKKATVAFKGSKFVDGAAVAFERTVNIAEVDDALYIQGLGLADETAWVKGVKTAEDTFTFVRGQVMGSIDGYLALLLGVNDNGFLDNVVLKKDAVKGVYTFNSFFIENTAMMDGLYNYLQYVVKGATIATGGEIVAPVEIPEDLKVEYYVLKTKDDSDKPAKVGIKGNDVYVQGFCTYIPEAWVKGTLADGKVTFKSGQFFGEYSSYGELYFLGYNSKTKEVVDLVLDYNADNGEFKFTDADVYIFINANSATKPADLFGVCMNVCLYKINEVAATPATPVIEHLGFTPYGDVLEFQVPMKDVNGNDIVGDKLTYVLYADNGEGEPSIITFKKSEYKNLKADMTEIPVRFFDDYDIYAGHINLNMNHSTWKRIGIQSIYRGSGEEHKSDIAWYTITWPVKNTLPEGVAVYTHDFKGEVLNRLTGQITPFTSTVQWALSGNDVYIQGLGTAGTESWIKGTWDDNGKKYIFSNAQEMGVYGPQNNAYNLYFVGIGVDDETHETYTTDVALLADVFNGVFIFQNNFSENRTYTDFYNPNSYFVAGATISMYETGINDVDMNLPSGKTASYNMAGQRVGKNYKGIVIRNGKKYLVK